MRQSFFLRLWRVKLEVNTLVDGAGMCFVGHELQGSGRFVVVKTP